MSHRDEFTPGDLSVRMSFVRVMGRGPDSGKVMPTIEVTDQVSGALIRMQLTAEQLTEMLCGGAADVSADKVTGYRGIRHWGRYQKVDQRLVDTQMGDYNVSDPKSLPYVAEAIAELEADGYEVATPRRNNSSKWVIFGRRYDEHPDA